MSSQNIPPNAETVPDPARTERNSKVDPEEARGLKHAVMVVAALNLGLLAAAIYLNVAVQPVAAESPAPVVVEEELEDTKVGAGPTTSAPARASGGRVRASRPAMGLYRAQGDISDIFCRPFPDETEQQWRARVADVCEV